MAGHSDNHVFTRAIKPFIQIVASIHSDCRATVESLFDKIVHVL